MPNHVTNRIIVSGPVEDVAAFKQLMIKTKMSERPSWYPANHEFVPTLETDFDFNQIIPQPKILDYIANPTRYGPNGRVMLFDHKDALATNEGREATEAEQAEITAAFAGKQDPLVAAMPGVMPGWYDWRVNNWGTKWNAYSYEPIDDQARLEFKIDTAWSAPNPVYDELAQRFPTLGFDLAWFDEGWMHAGSGSLGHCAITGTSEDFYTEPSDELYERVYGVPPISDDEFQTGYVLTETTADQLRLADNFTSYDVGGSMDDNGCFALTAVFCSDDPGFEGYPSSSDDELYKIRMYRDRIAQRLGIAI